MFIAFTGFCLTPGELQAQVARYVPIAYALDPEDAQWDLHILDALSGEQTHALSAVENECPVALSPDGQWLEFAVGTNTPDLELWLLNLDTEQRLSLRPYQFSAWSGDARFLAYSSENADQTVNIYVYDTTTSSEHLIEETARQPDTAIQLQWVGQTLHYVIPSTGHLYLRRYLKSEVTQETFKTPPKIGESRNVAMSPDGRSLALTGVLSPSQLFVLDISTGEWFQVNAPEQQTLSYVWSPDGQRLAFATSYDRRNYPNSLAIFVWDKGEQKAMLKYATDYGSQIDYMSWSPDGRLISFAEYHPGGTINQSYALTTLEVTSGETHTFSDLVDIWAGNMRWISASELVYLYSYAQLSPDDPNKQIDVYRYDVAEQETMRLTQTPGYEFFQCAYG
jgi:Tol biopolymer transport system component